jgi:hypothetical protein
MSLNPADIQWLMQRQADEPGIWLMTIEGPELGGKLYFARSPKPVTSRGQVYQDSWFEFEEPGDADALPEARISLPNVDRVVGLALEEAHSTLTLHFELIRDSDPDRVVMAWRMLELKDANADPLMVTGTLCAARFDDEPYAPLRVTPSTFPGLYQ